PVRRTNTVGQPAVLASPCRDRKISVIRRRFCGRGEFMGSYCTARSLRAPQAPWPGHHGLPAAGGAGAPREDGATALPLRQRQVSETKRNRPLPGRTTRSAQLAELDRTQAVGGDARRVAARVPGLHLLQGGLCLAQLAVAELGQAKLEQRTGRLVVGRVAAHQRAELLG